MKVVCFFRFLSFRVFFVLEPPIRCTVVFAAADVCREIVMEAAETSFRCDNAVDAAADASLGTRVISTESDGVVGWDVAEETDVAITWDILV